MAKVTVKIDATEAIKVIAKAGVQREIGKTVVKAMKEFIEAGRSPIAGGSRFVGYKAVEGQKTLRAISKSIRNQAKSDSATKAQKAQLRTVNKSIKKQTDELKKKGYPYSKMEEFPDKKVRPVNLALTGDMIRALTFTILSRGVEIGIKDKKQALKAETHNDGTQPGRVPRRQFIPNVQGQEFAISIMRQIKEIYSKALNAAIEKSNKK